MSQEFFIKGRMSSGRAVISTIFGEAIDGRVIGGLRVPRLDSLTRISARSSELCIRKTATIEEVIANIN